MRMKSIAATGSEHLFPPGFGVHGKHANKEQVMYSTSNVKSKSVHRHLRRRQHHPFRFLIESVALVFGLSASAVIFMVFGAALLIVSILGPFMMDFFVR